MCLLSYYIRVFIMSEIQHFMSSAIMAVQVVSAKQYWCCHLWTACGTVWYSAGVICQILLMPSCSLQII